MSQALSIPNETSIPLAQLPVGRRARILAVVARGAVRQRLFDMGLLPGRVVELLRVAPASGPLWLRLETGQLSLRRNEARDILVEPLPQSSGPRP